LSLAKLDAMPVLRQVSMEVRRVSPVVPVFFGKARHYSWKLTGGELRYDWRKIPPEPIGGLPARITKT
jgi:hypothetical protein